MTLAAQFDFKIIFPLVADYTIMVNNPDTVIQQFLMNQIDEVGNFSNLLMWNFGNELPLDDTLITRMNGLMDFIRNYTLVKWSRLIPVTVAVVDDPHTYDHLVAAMKVDVFSTNAGYRGLNFQGNFLEIP
jgi:Sec-independent protein secretion pathway component TatC